MSNVLIVDDDPISILIITKMLEQTGIQNIQALFTGKSALELLQNQATCPGKFPDVIFLDISMPVMNGLEFLKAFQNLPDTSTISIAIVSSSDTGEDMQKARSLGVSDFFTKPVSKQNIEAFLRRREHFLQLHYSSDH